VKRTTRFQPGDCQRTSGPIGWRLPEPSWAWLGIPEGSSAVYTYTGDPRICATCAGRMCLLYLPYVFSDGWWFDVFSLESKLALYIP